uniref:Nucleoside phosphorylase domain-containing protein n=1 Tax=Panagrolaimus sp. JU765 TaxID=591449 RepID=A0AC34Q2Q6_9BILA
MTKDVNGVCNIVQINNPMLLKMADDKLYHFGMNKNGFDFQKNFGDVKFVCTGGSSGRFEMYAKLFSEKTGLPLSPNLSKTDRFVMFKTGPVLWVNHGMGTPSMGIMLNEVLKLLNYAKAENVCFVRIGTSGGVGVSPGTVVVSTGAINGALEDFHWVFVNGKLVKHPAVIDLEFSKELYDTGLELGLNVVQGKTLCADDFYEGQMRLDGAFCNYTEEDKFAFLNTLKEKDVKNIEMEASAFCAITSRAHVKAAIVCVALLNRLKGDQVDIDHDTYIEYEMHPFKLITAYLCKKLNISK